MHLLALHSNTYFMPNTLYVFDIDGTLTDSIPTYLKVITEVMQKEGLVNIDTDYDNYLHHTDRYAIEYNWQHNFNETPNEDIHKSFDKKLGDALMQEPPVVEIAGAKKVLETLQEKNIPFAFGTGAYPHATAVKMKACNLPFPEEVLATSFTSISRAGFVKQAIKKANDFYNVSSFDKIVAVGDGVWDLKAAQELDIDFIGIGIKNKDKMIALGCDKWIPTMKDFYQFID